MQVILLQDVAKLGRKFALVSVPDGYALNQLIPRKLAEAATPENLKRLQKIQSTFAEAREKQAHSLDEVVALLNGKPLEIKAEANEQGHLFAALHEKDIANSMASLGAHVEPSLIHLPKPIKTAGQHTIELKYKDKNVALVVEIVPK